MHFSTDFGWYSIHLGIVHLEQGGGGGGGGGLLKQTKSVNKHDKGYLSTVPKNETKKFYI